MESLELSSARVVVEGRPSYLLVTERGLLTSADDVQRYAAFVESIATRRARTVLLIDARLGEPDRREAAVRDAFWDWLASRAVIFRVAWVLPTAAEVTGANRDAVSRGAPVRAFSTAQEAHRWLVPGAVATAPTVHASPAPRDGRASITGAAAERLAQTPASGARRPSPGGVERVAIPVRARDLTTEPRASKSQREVDVASTPLAAIRPSQVAIPRGELDRIQEGLPPDDARTVLRSDVVPRRPSLPDLDSITIEDTGSDDDR